MQITLKSESTTAPLMGSEGLPDPGLVTYFGLDYDADKETLGKLNEIKSYLSQTSSDEFEQMKELRNIRYRLGDPQIGTSTIEHIHKYIRLRKSVAELENQVKDMER